MSHTGAELINIAKKNFIPLTGVISKDSINDSLIGVDDCIYIINMNDRFADDGSLLQGTHWVVFMSDEGEMYYFNTYGGLPLGAIIDRVEKEKNIHYNTKVIQDMRRGNCGLFCLAMIDFITDNNYAGEDIIYGLEKFCDFFSYNYEKNEKILQSYLKFFIPNEKVRDM